MTMRSKLLILFFSSICTLTYAASSEKGEPTAAAAAPTLAPAASKDLPLHEMLSCATPEEAHQKSKAFMDAHISNLEDYVEYLSSPAIPVKDKYASLLLRYRRFMPATPPPIEMNLRITMLLGTLNVDLAVWQRKRASFMEISTSEEYAYDPENDMTALDVLYIKLFQITVADAMAEEVARLSCKLTYEEINTHVTTKEQEMARKAPAEEPFDFIYSWNLARMLRPFLSPIYLHMERMELFQSVYNKKVDQPASCLFVPNALYAYVNSTLTDAVTWINTMLKGGYADQGKAFIDKVNAVGDMPFGLNCSQFLNYRVKMTENLKRSGQKAKTTNIAVGKESGFCDEGEEFILWKKGIGFFAKGYKDWVDLLNEMSAVMKTIEAAKKEEVPAPRAGAGGAAAPSKAKPGKGKKVSAKEAEAAEAAFLEAAEAEAKKAKAAADATEFNNIILRLVEAQKRVAISWEEDLAIYTASLRRHAALGTAAVAPHTPAVKDWVKETIEADLVRYSHCQAMLERHFGLYHRGGSRIGVVDSVSHEMGFFDAPHPADDGHKDRGSLWRKSLQRFFERAGLYATAGAAGAAAAGAGASTAAHAGAGQ